MEQVVVNRLCEDGMVEVKIISDQAVEEKRMLGFVPRSVRQFAEVRCYGTSALSVFYGEVRYPARQVVEFRSPLWRKPRVLVVWRLVAEDGLRVSEVVEYVADWYFVQSHRRAQFAFLRALPKGVENCFEVGGLMLLEADWCPRQCVVVGG